MKTIYIVVYQHKLTKRIFLTGVNHDTFEDAVKSASTGSIDITPLDIISMEINLAKYNNQ